MTVLVTIGFGASAGEFVELWSPLEGPPIVRLALPAGEDSEANAGDGWAWVVLAEEEEFVEGRGAAEAVG